MNYVISSILYVAHDPFFWPSMAFTTMVGVFIGAIIYDGNTTEVKKMIASLMCYAILIMTVNATRVIPLLQASTNGVLHQPFASIVTIATVTIFYLLGTFIGVRITKKAHFGKVV